jgi:hypothetical protein
MSQDILEQDITWERSMKKLLFNPKPLSKPEQVYFDMLKKRPSG